MANNDDLSDSDKALFRAAMQGVRRLKTADKVAPEKRPIKVHKGRQTQQQDSALDKLSISDHSSQDVGADDFIEFARNGVSARDKRDLRQGKYAAQAVLDLHGKTIDQARHQVFEFLSICLKRELRCVRIIHGKGYRSSDNSPLLKNRINAWLRQHPNVLAFSSCQPKDGGRGAVYILLSRTR